ncbi:MAG: hypothetical protein RL385_2493, partial [Pseudomonadota bacterium]
MSTPSFTVLRTPRGLLLGSVLALSLTGCQMADSDAHVRADAMG